MWNERLEVALNSVNPLLTCNTGDVNSKIQLEIKKMNSDQTNGYIINIKHITTDTLQTLHYITNYSA